jgi:transcriptional regulator with XRE-family HTH domain
LDPPLVAELVRRRKALGWSQTRLALETGLTASLIGQYETLHTGLSPEAKEAVLSALAQAEAERTGTQVAS